MKTIPSFATILLVACAGSPPPATNSQVIESVATHEPADANAQTAADQRFAEETRGYRVVERKGQKYYCRSERSSGSNIKATRCISENDLRARVEQAERFRQQSAVGVRAE